MLNNLHFKTIISGAPEGFDAQLMAELAAESGLTILHIARDDRRMATTREAMKFFAPNDQIMDFPAWDCPPFSKISPNADVISRRTASLTELAQNPRSQRRRIVLTTLNSVLQRTPPPPFLKNHDLCAKVGDTLDLGEVQRFLSNAGYMASPNVHGRGEYAIRGGILDVFPAGENQPLRLDFFGNRLDGIRRFDPETQMTVGRETSIHIGLDAEFALTDESIARFRRRFRVTFGAAHSDDRVYQAVSEGLKFPGIENWLPYFHETLATLFDFLPDAIVCMDDGIETLSKRRWNELQSLYEERAELRRGGTSIPPVLSPDCLYLSPESLQNRLESYHVKKFVGVSHPMGSNVINANGHVGRQFTQPRAPNDSPFIKSVTDHLIELGRTRPVCIACWTNGSRARFASMLTDAGLKTSDISSYSQINNEFSGIFLAVFGIEHGFVSPDLAIISEQDIFGEKLIRTASKRRSSSQLMAEANGFLPGELVVHEDNGIGRYHGLKTIYAGNVAYDCAEIEYAGDARLFLPVVNIDLLTKFGSNEARLDRLGMANWQERKARMKKNLLNVAEGLLRVAAARSLQEAAVLRPENSSWDSFIARFPFTETDDQAQAIDDVLKDLQSGRPMDRLICGDVGFGKTEIAMRAAFVAAMDGMQVAMLAPTTLLVRQHYETFRDRLAGFPVNLRQLSRHTDRDEAALIKREMSDGHCDIVIGTHALLNRSISFRRLGLIIIDEEQSFGVEQKERLKELRTTSHVMSLTATPIPRSLQMGLSGVRDLSIISTPPVDRLAIRTYVMESDPITLRSAILHEASRNGQTFIVVPRVKDLPDAIDFMTQYVPNISFTVAHGQQSRSEMEERVYEFYNGRYQVLLSTTIIASGIDIPNANTMIIMRADRFGIAQLYQIRGRVGRSGIRAYAYITYNARSPLTGGARRRFDVLQGLDTLGAGFSLAAQDLDMRGGGNLLGHEQSGHIREIGIELYQKLLAEAVASLKTDASPSSEGRAVSPQINLHVPARIPETFVADLNVRLGLYRRMGHLNTQNEVEGYGAELIDRFGPLPEEVEALLQIVHIKLQCKQAGIAKFDAGPKGATVEFHNDKFSNTEGLVAFIGRQQGRATVRNNKLVLQRDWQNPSDRTQGAIKLSAHIAKIAADGQR